MKRLLTMILLFSMPSLAAEDKGKSLEVWSFAIFTPQITRRKIQPYFDHISEETKTAYVVIASNNIPEMLQRCKSAKPAIVLAPAPIGNRVRAGCNYSVIAVTHQDAHLFAKTGSSEKTIENVGVVGFVKGLAVNQIAAGQLLEVNGSFKSIIYSTYYELIKNFQKDNVDAFVISQKTMEAARFVEDGWQSIHQFSQQGEVQVLASPSMEPLLKNQIANILLRNDKVAHKTFQTTIGLGPFLRP